MNKKFAVSSGHSLVTKTAVEILKSSGNVFDATIGAAFSACICEPLLCGLGGGGFLLASGPNLQPIFFDFFASFPGKNKPPQIPQFHEVDITFASATQKFHIGPGSIAVPGCLKGFIDIHEKLGRMPLREVLEPARKLAQEGVTITPLQAYTFKLLTPIISHNAETRQLFCRDEVPLQEGDIFKNTELADFLSNLNHDLVCDFYLGELGQKLINENAEEILLTRSDLKDYQTIERQPLSYQYHDWKVTSSPLPAFGGLVLGELLSKLSENTFSLQDFGRTHHLKTWATVLKDVEESKGQFFQRLTKGTTHISITQKDGPSASLSMTNGEGSACFLPGTGMMINNMLGEEDLCDPKTCHNFVGERIPSMMAPSFLENHEKKYILGSGGSKRIRSSLMQVISNIVNFHKPLEEAINTPRFNWDGKALQAEPGWSPEILNEIAEKIPVNSWEKQNFYFGGVHGVSNDLEAYGDPRRDGFAETL